MSMKTYMYHNMCVRSEDNLWEFVLSFHHVSPRDHTRALRLGWKCVHRQSHLDSPFFPLIHMTLLPILSTIATEEQRSRKQPQDTQPGFQSVYLGSSLPSLL